MQASKVASFIFSIFIFSAHATDNENPQFSDYSVNISSGPFTKNLNLSNQQQKYSSEWRRLMESALLKSVNFSGHYIIYTSKKGELPNECGNDGWVCGWVIDKENGKVVSELPNFNGNTKYYSTIDNGTPSPDEFDMEFYAESSMLWIKGQNTPANMKDGEAKCANTTYKFISDSFVKLNSGKCEVDVGSDPYADPYLP